VGLVLYGQLVAGVPRRIVEAKAAAASAMAAPSGVATTRSAGTGRMSP